MEGVFQEMIYVSSMVKSIQSAMKMASAFIQAVFFSGFLLTSKKSAAHDVALLLWGQILLWGPHTYPPTLGL